MVAEILTFFTLIFWSIAVVKLLDYIEANEQAIAFFLHLFVLASNGWVQSLGGLYVWVDARKWKELHLSSL